MTMRIEQVEFLQLQRSQCGVSYQADMCLHLSSGAHAYINATSKNALADDPTTIRRLLLRDALRQMSWMPEVRRGELDLTQVPEIEQAIEQALLAA